MLKYLVGIVLIVVMTGTVFAVGATGLSNGSTVSAQVQDIETRLCRLYRERPVEATRLLESMVKKLNRVKVMAAYLKDKGQDVSGVETLVAAAEVAIKDAQTAIAGLASSPCPDLSETNARAEAEAALQALKVKLEAVRKAIIAATKAVNEAQRSLAATLNGGDDE